LGGATLLSEQSLPRLLSLAYPNHNWGIFQIKSKETFYKKSQFLLKSMLKVIFPKEGKSDFPIFSHSLDVLEEYRHPDILTSTGHPLELDFFYPRLNLAIEYQVCSHFLEKSHFLGTTTLSNCCNVS
jgi:hypothetical protein